MIRGTNAQFKFKLPYTKADLSSVTIKFWQPNNINFSPINKYLDDCGSASEESKELCVSLTADETLRFSDKYKARVQLRGVCKEDKGGTVFACRQQLITVYPLNDDFSGDIIVPANDDGFVILDGETISAE